ncbi:MAG: T9SS type A sorting domain-containing protein, partial [Ignavibacteriaceae bacterium]
ELHQNYPNPFNPSTKIKFTISTVETRHASSLQMVTLKVYDVIGNEIDTLVNEELPAGEYEVDFNATGLPSGVYYYKLKARDFIHIKKMVLIK